MSKKIFIVIIAFLVIWGLWSLPYSPIAWYDEIIFSSTTHSLITGNGMAAELDFYEPMVLYGPIYFWLTGLITKLFGFGIFTFRLTNFIFAFLTVIVLGRIYNQLHINSKVSRIFLLILLTDVLFVANSHSGRMEFVALFFVLIAYSSFLSPQSMCIKNAVIIAISLSFAFFTTPRAIVVAMPVALVEFYRLARQKRWAALTLYVTIPVVLLLSWIFYAYGSIEAMIAYITKPNDMTQTATFTERFLGISLNISFWHYPLILTALVSIACGVYYKKFKSWAIFICPIVLYYILVKDTGMYGVYILPFYLIIIGLAYTSIERSENNRQLFLYRILICVCVLFNIVIFVSKAAAITLYKDSRDPQYVTKWLKERVPKGSKLCGSYPYYYSAIDIGCPYKRISRDYVEVKVTYNNLIEKYHPDYLMVSKYTEDKQSLDCVDLFDKELVDSFCTDKEIGFLYDILGKIQQESSYDGKLYRITYK